jgi:hypothetical protein
MSRFSAILFDSREAPFDGVYQIKRLLPGCHNELRVARCRRPVPAPAALAPSPRPPAGGGCAAGGGRHFAGTPTSRLHARGADRAGRYFLVRRLGGHNALRAARCRGRSCARYATETRHFALSQLGRPSNCPNPARACGSAVSPRRRYPSRFAAVATRPVFRHAHQRRGGSPSESCPAVSARVFALR